MRNLFDFRHWSVWVLGFVPPAVVLLLLHVEPRSASGYVAEPASAHTSGVELVAVVLTADFCPFGKRDDVRLAIRRVIGELDSVASARGQRFAAIGVALDHDPVVGARFLEGLHAFDEMLVGGNWQSTAAFRYVWHDFPGPPEVPQLIVLRREVSTDEAARLISLKAEHVIKRLVGADAIAGFDIATIADDVRSADP